jgi:hypothetical protein
MRPARQADPFTVLGLPARRGLTDDEVRGAWRRIAAAAHPDRADGGDPARFAAAAAAYTELRTAFGRDEALADRAGPGRLHRLRRPVRWWPAGAPPGKPRRRPAAGLVTGHWWSRVRRGRPARLALRVAATAAVITAVALAAGSGPATPALITGALTWLALTARHDLAPPA